MRALTHTLAAIAATALVAHAVTAAAAEVSDVTLEAAVTDGDGLAVDTVVSGAAYWYDLNYAITGNDMTGVGATITVDLPEGLWVHEANAPATFTSNCTQAGDPGDYEWKFTCTFTASDLGISGAGGVSGQARVRVRSRRYFLAHGDAVAIAPTLEATWDDGGTPQTMSDDADHTMSFEASPNVRVRKDLSGSHNRDYYMMVGPNDEVGVAFDYRLRPQNLGTARLSNVVMTDTLPDGFLVAGFSHPAWTMTTSLWSSGTLTFTRGDWGHWGRVTDAGSIHPGNQEDSMLITLWAPCDALADTRDEGGAVPEHMLNVADITATGYGIHPDEGDDTVATHDLENATPEQADAAPPNLTNWACGTGQAVFRKLGAEEREAGSGHVWNLYATPEIASTYEIDAVVWDALDPSMDTFYRADILDQADAFTIHYCDLSGLSVNPATARGNFLGAWKDDPTRCDVAEPADGTAWAAITHIFFHAPTWGDPTPSQGYYVPRLHAQVFARTRADALDGSTYANTAWYESDAVALAERTHEGTIMALSRPMFHANTSVIGDNPPYVSPGESVTFTGLPHRSGVVQPLNPTATITLPDGMLYEGSSVAISSFCQNAEDAGTHPPGTFVPLAYSDEPTVTVNGDGTTTLEWWFGDATNPFRLQGGCPGANGVRQIRIYVDAQVDPNRSYVNDQELDTTFSMTAENEDTEANQVVRTERLFVQSPGEMRVEVVPWCEELGRVGFNAVYENTGGIDLNDVAVAFPIPETTDPFGGTPDVTHYDGATFDDATGALAFSTDNGATWSATEPGDLATVTDVRLDVPELAAVSGPQSFFIDLTVPGTNPGDGQIHATASMSSAQLSDASSPVSVPFVVDTCPQPVTVTKFFDANGDGHWDQGEPPLAGWYFEVHDGDELVDSGTTGQDGEVSFVLVPGTYTVTEELPTPGAADDPVWDATTGTVSQSVEVTIGGANAAVFGNNCACDDGDACTDDICDPTLGCIFNPIECDDGDACTANGCDPESGCTYTGLGVGASCNDGNACTSGETCDADGACIPTDVVTCDEAPECHTASVCDPDTGHCSAPEPVADGTPCDDEIACTSGDACTNGVCAGTDACAADAGLCDVADEVCNSETGVCEYEAAMCVPDSFYALVEDDNGDIVGAIRCAQLTDGYECDRDDGGDVVVYADVLTCEH